MKKMWKGLMAFAMMLVFCVVAFSPGTALAAEKAASYLMIAELHTLEPTKTAAGAERYDKRSEALVSLSSPYAKLGAAATASQDGYMNWRMRDTTRNI